jgi:predicted transcriptional regulator
MSEPWRAAVNELSQSGHYNMVIQKIESMEPVVPVFDYKNQSNFEEIKFKLAQKSMWELVLTILKGKSNG